MPPLPQPKTSEKSTNFNVHLIKIKHFFWHKRSQNAESFTGNLFLSLLVYVDQTCNTKTSYTIRDFRPPQKKLNNQFNLKPSQECRGIGTITSIQFDAFL